MRAKCRHIVIIHVCGCMHTSYFLVSLFSLSLVKVPAELYDAALQHLFLFDHTSVDAIMRRKCLEMEEKE